MADKQLWQVTPVATDVKNDDGVIIGGQTAGTRYAPLTLIASFVHNLWAAFINAITPLKTSFANGDKIPVVNGSTATAMEASKLLELTAQNALAGNVATEFDSTKPNDAGGYAYYKNEIVSYQGATYRFKVNHSSGDWNAVEVDRYDASESLKFFIINNNPEYVYAITDKDDRILFCVKKNGEVEWQKGVPSAIRAELDEKVDKEIGKSLIDSAIAKGFKIVSNPEYVYAVVDSNDKFLFGVKKEGSFEIAKGVPFNIKKELDEKVDKEIGKSLIDSAIAKGFKIVSNPEYVYAVVDSNDRLLFGLNVNGDTIFGVGIPSSIEDELNRIYAYLKDNEVKGNAFQVIPRCACIGDSLSAGYSTYNSDKITDDIAKKCGINWPSYIAKRNGIYFKNIAREGATARSFREGYSLDSLTGLFDAFFVGLGCNDRNNTDIGTISDIAVSMNLNADTFYGNYDYVVRKLHSLCPSAKIFVMTMPDYVIGAGPYNTAIRYIAGLYSYVYLIDLANQKIYKEDFIQSLITDGTHFSPYGYEVVSHVIENCVNTLFLENGENFKTFASNDTYFGVPGSRFDSLRDEYAEAVIDCDGKLLESIDKQGNKKFFSRVKFEKGISWTEENLNELAQALREAGYNI